MTNIAMLQKLLNEAHLDFEFAYKVHNKSLKNACRVCFFDNQPQVILLTDLRGRGMSVTNSVEYIIPQLERFLIIEKSIPVQCDCIYIEHYDKESWNDLENIRETFDRVTFFKNDPEWSNKLTPSWSRLTENEVLNLISY